MDTQVLVNLPEPLYFQVKQVAEHSNIPVEDVLVRFTKQGVEALTNIGSVETDPDVEREKQAYLAMHDELVQSYLEQHVAIKDGKLVDHDENLDELWSRVETTYPDEYVWVTTVREEPIQTIRIPSFRLSQSE